MSSFDPERIIAVDLRPQSLGFVVLEGEDRLLDWGVKSFRGGTNTVRVPFGPKVSELISAYVPDAIVLRSRIGTDAMLSELEQTASVRGAIVHLLAPSVVKNFFSRCRNKDQIASAVCDHFLELLPALPPKRKVWKKEDYRMRIFDAAATGIAYFTEKQKGTTVSNPPIRA